MPRERPTAPLLRAPAALAADLGRFLRSEPIEARPIGLVGRFGKWVMRRPYQAGLAGLAGLAVIGGLRRPAGPSTAAARWKSTGLRERLSWRGNQKNLADANYRNARAAIQAILDCYNDPAFAKLPRRGELQRAQAEKALIFYDRLLARRRVDATRSFSSTRPAPPARPPSPSTRRDGSSRRWPAWNGPCTDRRCRSRTPERSRRDARTGYFATKLGMLVWHTRKQTDGALAEVRAHRRRGSARAIFSAFGRCSFRPGLVPA